MDSFLQELFESVVRAHAPMWKDVGDLNYAKYKQLASTLSAVDRNNTSFYNTQGCKSPQEWEHVKTCIAARLEESIGVPTTVGNTDTYMKGIFYKPYRALLKDKISLNAVKVLYSIQYTDTARYANTLMSGGKSQPSAEFMAKFKPISGDTYKALALCLTYVDNVPEAACYIIAALKLVQKIADPLPWFQVDRNTSYEQLADALKQGESGGQSIGDYTAIVNELEELYKRGGMKFAYEKIRSVMECVPTPNWADKGAVNAFENTWALISR